MIWAFDLRKNSAVCYQLRLLRAMDLIKSLSERKGWREEEGKELIWATGSRRRHLPVNESSG